MKYRQIKDGADCRGESQHAEYQCTEQTKLEQFASAEIFVALFLAYTQVNSIIFQFCAGFIRHFPPRITLSK